MPRAAKVRKEEIFRNALALIDEEGLDALSMRRLGGRLGVEAMSLYNHVQDKAGLLEGVVALLLSDIAIPELSGNWRKDLSSWAKNWVVALSIHPHAGVLLLSRPFITENSQTHAEFIEHCLTRAIPQPLDRSYAFLVVQSFLLGYLVTQSNLARSGREAASQRAPSTEVAFELGMVAILDGIERRSPF